MKRALAWTLLSTPLLLPALPDGGAAGPPRLVWGDFDADGLADLVAVEADGRVRLHRNAGDGTLEDVTQTSGVQALARRASWQDVDGDGSLDLHLVKPDGTSALYRGLGGGRFEDATSASGLDRAPACVEASWLDYDQDGHADLELWTASGVRLLHNDGRGVLLPTPLAWTVAGNPIAGVVAPGTDPAAAATEEAGRVATRGAAHPPAARGANDADRYVDPAAQGRQAVTTASGIDPHAGGNLPTATTAICATGLEDQANPGSCINASTTPTLGQLFPLAPELFVHPTGNVGFGTTSPRSQAHLRGSGADATLRLSTLAPSGVSKVLLLENNNPEGSLEGGVIAYDGVLDQLQLSTLAGTEKARLVVDAGTGRIGVGTATPASRLHVRDADGTVARLESSDPSATRLSIENTDGPGRTFDLGVTGSAATVGSGKLLIRDVTAGNLARLTLDASGNLGVGATSPLERLHVAGNIRCADTLLGSGSLHLSGDSAGGPDLSILAGGQCGVRQAYGNVALNVRGQATDLYALNVERDDGTLAFRVRNQGQAGVGATYNNVALNVRGGGTDAYLLNTELNDGTPAFRVSASGQAGVGTIYSDVALTARAASGDQYALYAEKSNGNPIFQVRTAGGEVGLGQVYTNCTLNVRSEASEDLILNLEKANGTAVLQVERASGDVVVLGDLQVVGAKAFVLDHPLDPANKSLVHNAVEGPGYYTYYRGNVVLAADGAAWVELPDYFEALNAEPSYQLTCVGAPAPVYVAEEVRDNRFRIAGGRPGLKVSWQVSAVRHDPYARDNPFQAEVEKQGEKRGRFFYPEGHGAGAEQRIGRIPARYAARPPLPSEEPQPEGER